MIDPFAHVRRRVLTGVPDPAFTPYLTAVGVFRTGTGYVARFPGVGYARRLYSMAFSCSVVCPISLYLGEIPANGSRLSTYGDGSKTSYNPPSPDWIAPNVPLLVVWETSTSGGSASANGQFRQA